ncbi:hypothetical protein [Tengunoibacter tsumagoiensis]|uniref:Uncharacterized protein n=1 Tax=Tengunoibacter tsumagoiensis TaxID=2014871 RepID=A0A402A091_9CHLR|nr:hypothetical protein [Tengunoibacter tsumagoiensis]GCE12479.1 hypothetical protein KTT_23380 [Tengunoibacter tsumagoiensis]
MGYNTSFTGTFRFNRFLRPEHKAYLHRFAEIRHEALHEEKLNDYPDPLREAVGLPIGKYGMYFTGFIDPKGVGDDILLGYCNSSEIYNIPDLLIRSPEAFWIPSTFCQWEPTVDGRGIEANGDKFYRYVDWLHFLLNHFLIPWGYELSGTVSYEGEQGEHGRIIVSKNEVQVIVDGASLVPRSKEGPEFDEVPKTHWMTLGSVSDAARQALLEAGATVVDLYEEPPVVLVGIPYDWNYYERFGRVDLSIWTTEGIWLDSKQLRLEWSHNNFPGRLWGGFPRQRLILPDEPYESLE